MMRSISLVIAALVFMTACADGIAAVERALQSITAAEAALPDKSLPGLNNMEGWITLTLKAAYKGFQSPTGIAVDDSGNIYISNWSGGTVIKIDTRGGYSIFAEGMGSPAGLTFGGDGNLYISDYSKDVIYKVTPGGKKSVFTSGLHTPTGISFNKAGDLLVTNRGGNEIVRVDASGKVELVAGGMRTPVGVVEAPDGSIYVTNYGGGIVKVTAGGEMSTASNEFGRPGVGIAISRQGVIFAAKASSLPPIMGWLRADACPGRNGQNRSR